jgi:hypothetical protein
LISIGAVFLVFNSVEVTDLLLFVKITTAADAATTAVVMELE